MVDLRALPVLLVLTEPDLQWAPTTRRFELNGDELLLKFWR